MARNRIIETSCNTRHAQGDPPGEGFQFPLVVEDFDNE
jgi:hypothetical protein